MANLAFTGVTESSFYVYVDNLQVGYVGGRNCSWFVGPTWMGTTTIPDGASSGGGISATGLAKNTTYAIVCNITNNSGEPLTTLTGSVTTLGPSRPANFYWNAAELNALNYQGYTTSLTYLRWNAFVSAVEGFRQYKGLPSVPASAYMSSSDRMMTASRFNTVRLMIGSMASTGLVDVYPGDIVYGHYFIMLQNSLNSIA